MRRVEPLSGPSVQRCRVGDLEIRTDEGLVLRDGRQLSLTRTEFRLLAELARARGRGLHPGGAAGARLGIRLLRRQPAGRRARAPAAHQGRARPRQPAAGDHGPRPGLPARSVSPRARPAHRSARRAGTAGPGRAHVRPDGPAALRRLRPGGVAGGDPLPQPAARERGRRRDRRQRGAAEDEGGHAQAGPRDDHDRAAVPRGRRRGPAVPRGPLPQPGDRARPRPGGAAGGGAGRRCRGPPGERRRR